MGVQSSAGWEASLFANNLFNKHAWLEDLVQESLGNPSFNRVVTNQPLTIGVDLTYKY
jgi:iron complex outermembrane receptor protein